jgi:hypothetical protein
MLRRGGSIYDTDQEQDQDHHRSIQDQIPGHRIESLQVIYIDKKRRGKEKIEYQLITGLHKVRGNEVDPSQEISKKDQEHHRKYGVRSSRQYQEQVHSHPHLSKFDTVSI